MRIIFMGSGQLACPAIDALLASATDEVVAVVTQPDRPGGRNLRLKSCPVKARLIGRAVPVLSPEHVSEPGVVAQLAAFQPDVIVVAAFGQFLKSNLLSLPPKGCVNIHPSLLPKYRGAAPIQWAIANGDSETGVTIMYMNQRMDAGDVILQERVGIGEEDTAVTLEPVLAQRGADLLLKALDAVRNGTAPRRPQNEADVILAPKLKKEDGRIEWGMSAVEIRNRVRGFAPWPACFCEVPDGSGHFLRVWTVRVESGRGRPGSVIEAGGDGPLVACGEGALRLLEVQPEGGKPMNGAAYLCGHKMKGGELLG